MPTSGNRRTGGPGGWLPPAVFAGGSLLVVAVHPDRFSGWALWALSPVLLYLAYLLVFRTPPQTLRVWAASAVAVGYSAAYGLAAGVGDESFTDVARLVYVFLPALGLAGILACLVVVELVAAALSVRSPAEGVEPPPPRRAPSAGRSLAVAALVIGAWGTFAVTGWGSPKVVVAAGDGGEPPTVAEVRCVGDDTHLLTPVVVTQPDGVHLRIENSKPGEVELEYEVDGGSGGGGGEVLPPGVSHRVVPFAADSVGVACVVGGRGVSAYAAMTVLDPADRARPPQVDCAQSTSDSPGRDAVSGTDPVAAARTYLRDQDLLRPEDVLHPAAGPAPEFPVVLLLRRGRALASLRFSPGEGRSFTLESADVCEGA